MSKWVVDIHGEIEGDYEIIKKYEEPKAGAVNGFTRNELENWLCEVAINNLDNGFGEYVQEIINRLDGFERYVKDTRAESEGNE